MFLEISQNSQELLKNRLWHRCFPVNFAKFLRISFLQDTSDRLIVHEHKPFASIQLNKNFWFTELKLHGFHQVKITYVLFQRKRHSSAVVHSCSSSRSQMFFKIGVLKIFAIFTGKHLRYSLFLIKFKDLKETSRCFNVNIAKFLRTAFL